NYLDALNYNIELKLRWPNGTQEILGNPEGASQLSGISVLYVSKRETDRNGNQKTFEWQMLGAAPVVSAVVDAHGRRTRYQRRTIFPVGIIEKIFVPGPGGTDQVWEMTWGPLDFDTRQLFPEVGDQVATHEPRRQWTLTSLKQPDGRAYTFSYAFPGGLVGWGALTSVTNPDGLVTKFDYGDQTTFTPDPPGWRSNIWGFNCDSVPFDALLRRRVIKTTVDSNGLG